MSCMEHFH